MGVKVAGDGIDAGLEGLCGLVARGGAEVEKGLAGGELEEGDDGLGADVLNAGTRRRRSAGDAPCSGESGGLEVGRGLRVADVHFGFNERVARDGGGCFGAVVASPLAEEPGGAREFDGQGRPGDGVAGDLAEDGVDEAGGEAFAAALGEFDAFVDGGVAGYAVEVAKLKDAHPEGCADAGLGFGGAAGVVVDQEVELGLVAEAAKDDVGGESGVTGVEGGGVFNEEV